MRFTVYWDRCGGMPAWKSPLRASACQGIANGEVAPRWLFDVPASEQALWSATTGLRPVSSSTFRSSGTDCMRRNETQVGRFLSETIGWSHVVVMCTAYDVWSLPHEIFGLSCVRYICLGYLTQGTVRLVCTRRLLPRVMDLWTRWSNKQKQHKILYYEVHDYILTNWLTNWVY